MNVSPTDLRKVLDIAFACKRSIFIWGPPGIGKSSIVRDYAIENGFHFVDIRLSYYDPLTFGGLPVLNSDHSEVNWAPPSFIVKDKSIKTLYFLDELNSAPSQVQSIAYQMVLEKRINNFDLGPNAFVVAAGNGSNDRGIVYTMPSPLANRFIHVNLEVDYEDFKKYAIFKNFHPYVLTYLESNKSDLYFMSETQSQQLRGFPTPRSWEAVSDILYCNSNMEDNIMYSMISGTIGDNFATKFFNFKKFFNLIPDIDSIVKGDLKVYNFDLKEKSNAVLYATVLRIVYALNNMNKKFEDAKNANMKEKKERENLLYSGINNSITFGMNNFPPEYLVMMIKTMFLLNINFNPGKIPVWKEFSDKYSSLIIG